MAQRPSAMRRQAWVWGALLALGLLIALGWTVWREPDVQARPALWRISGHGHQAWLFGSMHVVPDGARWLSPAIEKAILASDQLILEVADNEADNHSFEALGRGPQLPPLPSRLPVADRPALAAIVHAAPTELTDLDQYENWAAALLISAAAESRAGFRRDQASESVLAQSFRARGRPVVGLETVRAQLSIFDHLSANDQTQLLTQAVREAPDAAAQLRQLYQSWSIGDLAAIERATMAPLAQTPHLREALLDNRTAAWAKQLDKMMRQHKGMMFIAVGSGHLIGGQGLPALLSQSGWRVERVQ